MAEEMRLAVQRAERQAGVLMETARRHAKKTEETARENAKRRRTKGANRPGEEAEALQKGGSRGGGLYKAATGAYGQGGGSAAPITDAK